MTDTTTDRLTLERSIALAGGARVVVIARRRASILRRGDDALFVIGTIAPAAVVLPRAAGLEVVSLDGDPHSLESLTPLLDAAAK